MIDLELFKSHSGQFPKFEEVELPEGIGTARIKVMSVREKDAFDIAVNEKKYGFRSGLIAICAINDQGYRVFSDDEISTIDNMPIYIVEPLVDAAIRVNRLSKKDQDELAKNSNGQPGGLLSV